MDNQSNDKYLKGIRGALYFFAALACLAILKICSSMILPLVIAGFIFVFVNPLLNKLDSLRVPKWLSTIVVLLIVVLFFVLCIITFFSMVNMLIKEMPFYYMRIRTLDDYITRILSKASHFVSAKFDTDAFEFLANGSESSSFSILSWLSGDGYSMILSSLTGLTSKFISIIGTCMLVFLYLLFLMLERQTIMPKAVSSLPYEKALQLSSVVSGITKQISRYLGFKALISFFTGVLFYVAAALFGLNFPLVWGVLAFLLNFIPTIGSIVITVAGIFMAVLQFIPQWSTVIYIAISFIAIEMVLGNIIDPKIQGVKLNLSPFLILVSLAIWNYIWGPIGMFLAVPLTSIIQIVCASIPSLKSVAIMLSTGSASVDKKSKNHDDSSYE